MCVLTYVIATNRKYEIDQKNFTNYSRRKSDQGNIQQSVLKTNPASNWLQTMHAQFYRTIALIP